MRFMETHANRPSDGNGIADTRGEIGVDGTSIMNASGRKPSE